MGLTTTGNYFADDDDHKCADADNHYCADAEDSEDLQKQRRKCSVPSESTLKIDPMKKANSLIGWILLLPDDEDLPPRLR